MTFKEKFLSVHPEMASEDFDMLRTIGFCPNAFRYEDRSPCDKMISCFDCWDREMPEEKE